VATDVRDAVDTATLTTSVRTHRRRAWFLLAFAAWNVWVWATRLNNMIRDAGDFSAAFVAVHVVLYVGGFGGAAVLAAIGWRMLSEARAAEVSPRDGAGR
jgi:hypothetical protein